MTRRPEAGPAYTGARYAASLAEFGTPVHLPRSGGWLLERPVPGTALRDLTGPYPLFACRDWSGLGADLDELEGAAVSVVLVPDPLSGVPVDLLRTAFRDHVTPFKQHLVRELATAVPLTSSHRRHVRRALRSVEVEVVADPLRHLDDWVRLYGHLVGRHRLTGVRAFSVEAFRQQLALPGLVAVRAERDGVTVCMTLWLVGGENAYYHLGASSDAGREVSASYAVFAIALDHLRDRGVRYVDLGGVAGAEHRDDGLSRFKGGWANAERVAHLCGRILDRPSYTALTALAPAAGRWFPAYRAGDRDPSGQVRAAEETRGVVT
ncbi:GNAT family N-acetyltransferase [Geodermatophilus maliterrae]|uniref:GNAT family N-acetyltransferase n=1 Tax=Geodermatophilus maliterrae TaxID=3162531 RepID=A0ABV3XLZ9_9ACTN